MTRSRTQQTHKMLRIKKEAGKLIIKDKKRKFFMLLRYCLLEFIFEFLFYMV